MCQLVTSFVPLNFTHTKKMNFQIMLLCTTFIYENSLSLSILNEESQDNVCDYYSEEYDLEQCEKLELQNQCKTVDGTPCVFPFMFRGKEVTNCISGSKRTRPWCPTQVDRDGVPVLGQWGNCDEHCLTVTDDKSTFGKLSLQKIM